MPKIYEGKVLFDLALLLFFVVLTLTSFLYNPTARLIPLIFGAVGCILMLFQFLSDASPSLQEKLSFVRNQGVSLEGSGDSTKQVGLEATVLHHPVLVFFWLVLLVALLYLLPYQFATALFVFSICRFQARESTGTALGLALAVGLSLYAIFDLFLHVTF